MTRDEAVSLLGLSPAETGAEAVRAAFARRAKNTHPDTAPGGAVTVSLRDLQTARNMLISGTEAPQRACKLCNGMGKVRGAIGWVRCSACKGKGDTV